ncbi:MULTISPECIES: 3,4-dihydroxy-2-butanone-4-phosphate synthase [Myroides]|uniref:3,4-dihydroxy-2-butanone 4-phosphate synthase n=1 Tax=Myroides albus TaxID=2562892 RepID=A0A6I3LKD9_9FLAO|nr:MULTISPECIES: 3,4-dihydroxy-2-butanone-4-phosphate synthase [Myroides]MTG98284.1 3,4-dihydroxy-2-butanone-4-phosphate synthase [Myroides albus]MVX37203.1 3,4-dihydroxy-2-butanone-4-phosphate synthase [Myroides sp. LoEW2-1]UVD78990.1 3,4-dihydroxy-2-butanone-4-phosphate synthase [Myroides albus]
MSHNHIQLNTIEEAIEDIRQGKVVIVVDDEDRENEGDFIAAAEMVTPEMINFMATYGRGLICAPLTQSRCKELDLHPMVTNNTVLHQTAFTVTIDLKGHGCTTGISVHDRAKTIESLVKEDTKAEDLGRPGHIFPLIAKEGGVLRRTGHTEAAVDLARLAGLKPAGILVEILNEDGSMARLPQLMEVAKQWDLKIISIENLVAYRMKHDSLIEKKEDFEVDTRFGKFRLRAYQQNTNQQVHIALTKGDWQENEAVLTRINSMIGNNDILDALSGKLDKRIEAAFEKVNQQGKGAILFINQEELSSSLLKRLALIKEQGACLNMDTPKLAADQKDFGIGAQILHDLKIGKINLMTNSEQAKRVGMTGYGLEIEDYIKY